MAHVVELAPFEGGWSVKIADTGEVLFFASRRLAGRQARRLAAATQGEVRHGDLLARLADEWRAVGVFQAAPLDSSAFAYPLGPPV
jgi:hypothetical protein